MISFQLKVAYFGGAQSALDYFEKMGLPCAIHFNPADFLGKYYLHLNVETFQFASVCACVVCSINYISRSIHSNDFKLEMLTGST